jgi:hypothetical protein
MFKPKATLILVLVCLMATAALFADAPQAQATGQVTIRFTATGFSNYNSYIMTINGTAWTLSDLSGWKTFSAYPGDTFVVSAYPKITNYAWPARNYTFTSWTNGNGLVEASGVFTVPNSGVTVTANYQLATHLAVFNAAGLSNFNNLIMVIDGKSYLLTDIGAAHAFAWDRGTTHIIEALSPVLNYDTPNKGYNFTSWTNGNGLVDADGTFIMPDCDVTVTATYTQSTVKPTFQTSGLSKINSGVTILTIDGVSYDIYQIPNFKVQWFKTSNHTVTATPVVTGWDGVKHYFTGWTNGNGLSDASTTFTTPNTDVTVTANYGLTPPAATTTRTLTCTPNTVNPTTEPTTVITGSLTSTGTGVTGKTVTLSYFDGVNWVSIGTATTTTGGAYTYSWNVPATITNGVYPVQAEFAGDSCYKPSSAVTGSSSTGLFVVPEYAWGGLAALLACFAALVLYLKTHRHSN